MSNWLVMIADLLQEIKEDIYAVFTETEVRTALEIVLSRDCFYSYNEVDFLAFWMVCPVRIGADNTEYYLLPKQLLKLNRVRHAQELHDFLRLFFLPAKEEDVFEGDEQPTKTFRYRWMLDNGRLWKKSEGPAWVIPIEEREGGFWLDFSAIPRVMWAPTEHEPGREFVRDLFVEQRFGEGNKYFLPDVVREKIKMVGSVLNMPFCDLKQKHGGRTIAIILCLIAAQVLLGDTEKECIRRFMTLALTDRTVPKMQGFDALAQSVYDLSSQAKEWLSTDLAMMFGWDKSEYTAKITNKEGVKSFRLSLPCTFVTSNLPEREGKSSAFISNVSFAKRSVIYFRLDGFIRDETVCACLFEEGSKEQINLPWQSCVDSISRWLRTLCSTDLKQCWKDEGYTPDEYKF